MIYVLSGWWYCIFNFELIVVVIQNFVNKENFGFVCLDMVFGYQYKGVCCVGFFVVDDENFEEMEEEEIYGEDDSILSYFDFIRKEKRVRMNGEEEIENYEEDVNGVLKRYNMWKNGFFYDIDFLSKFFDKERDYYNFLWFMGNFVG